MELCAAAAGWGLGRANFQFRTMEALPHPDDVERSDADPRLIAAIAVGVAIFLAATPFVLKAIYPPASKVAGIESDLPRPSPPVLEIHPKTMLSAQRDSEDAALTHYGWNDKSQAVAHIPIERAMQLLADRGLPGWPSAPPAR